ncbi:MAG: trypsin-like peptidase domain-containing protein [Myxococcaceae bacterium]|nr:trypsin-like peptidase domain-containing protein [Myxococcaceae bacterium]
MALAPSSARADRASRRDAVVEVVERVSPAVVHIATEQIVDDRRDLDPFEQLFDDLMGGRDRRRAVQSLGSGAIIDPSGIIVTNDHVIRGASSIHVKLADGRQLEGEVIGSDRNNDLAVVKVKANAPLPVAKLGTSSDLMIGETVIAIGSPFGLAKTVTVGVVSAVGRSFRADGRIYNDFVQTDASINPGNSGGPLLNTDGEVIGINTAIFASAQGIGFAIPADKVRRIVKELTQFGKVRPAWVGIQSAYLTPDVAGQLGWDRTYGALVVGTDPESPADKAGLQRGDIVTEIDRVRVVDSEDLDVRLRAYPAKSKIEVTIFRNGETRMVTIVPVEFPTRLAEDIFWDRIGVRVEPRGREMVIVNVRRGSSAEQIGLRRGDAILRINNKPVPTREAFRDVIADAHGARSILLLVRRGPVGYHLTLPF